MSLGVMLEDGTSSLGMDIHGIPVPCPFRKEKDGASELWLWGSSA